ncbi:MULTISPECIES: nSTAND1 domain-containing NTPase [Leptospira]|uniref:nSTAND1 domain-containing NTPase n=1 Tax=Leptospira TaxID=171 RepID=UPI001F1C0AB0|nr:MULTISPECIES: ATP-binding protein [Leptospira]MDO6383776.1 ATP-binding protein [Leptospira santarosai]
MNKVFSPTSPIKKKDFFIGRFDQITEILSSMTERGQHIILYGERGVGKTSLSNITKEIFDKHTVTSKITCSKDSTFNQLWDKAFKEIVQKFEISKIGFDSPRLESHFNLNDFKEKRIHDIGSVISIFSKFQDKRFFIIFDEYDIIENQQIKSTFASLIKSLSDNNENITIMLVGIGESINELIGEHPSLERCLKQIHLQRMSSEEIYEIIEYGLKALNLQMEASVKKSIVDFSQGFPHFAHLLAKYSCERALFSKSDLVTDIHFKTSVKRATENVHETIRNLYEQAIRTTKAESNFKDVLYSCALAVEDEHGSFRAKDLEHIMSELQKKETKLYSFTYHLGKLSQGSKGNILLKVGTAKHHRYKFRNPMLKAFLKLRYYKEKNGA